ncbi:MAG TPA: hypothetical protein VMX17_10480 [Candidatus Glassbacteria bacterium]|nr:hypothetical protein [Candidatus Glassbacteria bacterium]
MTKKKFFTYEDLLDSTSEKGKREKMIVTPQKEFIKMFEEKHLEIIHLINDNFSKLNNKQNKINTEFAKLFKTMESTLENFSDKLSSNEETFLFLMHNIKKNQFLYSNYPDDWIKSYLDIKNCILFENRKMDEKIEKNGN